MPSSVNLGNLKRSAAMHGISWEEKYWLLRVQNHVCPICLDKLEMAGSSIDHCHDCTGTHLTRMVRNQEFRFGCKKCIRGILHNRCNVWLQIVEKYPHLQTDVVTKYLARRPFCRKVERVPVEGPVELPPQS